MNEQIIYGIMTSTEGDNIGPFFETEADANDYIVKIKATEKGHCPGFGGDALHKNNTTKEERK